MDEKSKLALKEVNLIFCIDISMNIRAYNKSYTTNFVLIRHTCVNSFHFIFMLSIDFLSFFSSKSSLKNVFKIANWSTRETNIF